ncbi:MAG: hypothetical protein RL122_2753 [Pseudomonadota bacterium]|jgi:predicted RNA-binding Zn-ribbon protein involved in translation (DUF1610 family)
MQVMPEKTHPAFSYGVNDHDYSRTCPECQSTFLLRAKRSWYEKMLTRRHLLHFHCHDCGANLWLPELPPKS